MNPFKKKYFSIADQKTQRESCGVVVIFLFSSAAKFSNYQIGDNLLSYPTFVLWLQYLWVYLLHQISTVQLTYNFLSTYH